jgi:hypothetical protein
MSNPRLWPRRQSAHRPGGAQPGLSDCPQRFERSGQRPISLLCTASRYSHDTAQADRRHRTMKFNHVANRLDPRYFETVVEMLKVKLGFVELRRTERAIWLRQKGTNVDLQFSRSATANRDADKLRSQVSFLSETPRADLEDLVAWAKAHGMDASVGSYSEKEFYLDAPAAFVDFVFEAMTPDLAEYGVEV